MMSTFVAELETIAFCLSDKCSSIYIQWLKETIPVLAFNVQTFQNIRMILDEFDQLERLTKPVLFAKANQMKLQILKGDLEWLDKAKAESSRDAIQCASIVLQNYRTKKRIEKINEISKKGSELKSSKEQQQWEQDAPQQIFEAFLDVEDQTKSIEQLAIEEVQSDHAIDYIPTGFKNIDNLIRGVERKNLVVVGARPSMGKTAFICNLALKLALSGYRGGIFSAEMSNKAIFKRMVQAYGKLSREDMQTKKGEAYQACVELSKLPLIFDDTSVMTPGYICSTARKIKALGDIDFIMIDYLQLLTFTATKNQTYSMAIGDVTKTLKALCKDLNIVCFLLSQLNRDLEKRQDKRPILADLRESGSIEQDADNVFLLYRAGFYNKEMNPNIIDLNIAKNREGRTGNAFLHFNMEHQHITDIRKME